MLIREKNQWKPALIINSGENFTFRISRSVYVQWYLPVMYKSNINCNDNFIFWHITWNLLHFTQRSRPKTITEIRRKWRYLKMLRFYLDFTHSRRRRVYIDNLEFATCVTFLKARTSVKAFKKEIKALQNVRKRSRMKTYIWKY